MHRFTMTLTIETKHHTSIEALHAALHNIKRRLQAEQRINWTLEQLVQVEGVDWYFHVRDIAMTDETQGGLTQ